MYNAQTRGFELGWEWKSRDDLAVIRLSVSGPLHGGFRSAK
jgi:hypothetical protein